jgi:hypothetical protein
VVVVVEVEEFLPCEFGVGDAKTVDDVGEE